MKKALSERFVEFEIDEEVDGIGYDVHVLNDVVQVEPS